jgi:hypothetical protein
LPTILAKDSCSDAGDDSFNKIYTNQVKIGNDSITVHWDGHTSKTPINKVGEDMQAFNSLFI